MSGMHSSRIASDAFDVFFPEKTLWRYIGGVLCCCCVPLLWSFPGHKCKGSCWYVSDEYVCVASYVLDVLLAADCGLIISSSEFFCFLRHTSTFQLPDIKAVVTGVVPSPPP